MSPAGRSRSERVYAALLLAYPRGFRRRFGADLVDLFADLRRRARADAGRRGEVLLWLQVLLDLCRTAPHERLLALRDAIRDLTIPSPRTGAPRRAGDGMLQTLTQDLRYSARILRKHPLFTAVAIVVIALGSGAVTTIFSAMNAILLRPIPGVADQGAVDDIVRTQGNGAGSMSASYPYYRQLADGSHTMSGIAAWTILECTISTARDREAVHAAGNLVSGNYFRVLGARPALGRFFLPDEDRTEGTHPVVVIGYGYWQRAFGGDSAVLGRTAIVNGAPFTVIGVAPRDFNGTFPIIRTDVWVPIMMQRVVRHGGELLANPNAGWLELFGRRRPGITREAATAELAAMTKALAGRAGESPDHADFSGARLYGLSGLPVEGRTAVRLFMALLLAVSGLVLMIASVNVASMLLARAVSRRREMAVRVALGAGRARLLGQLLTESVTLFALGAVGGVAVAVWGARLLERVQLPVEMPLDLRLTPDGRVLAFALLLALVTGVIFGLAPALQALRVDIATGLHSDTAGSGRRRSRTRNALVVGQMALSLLLLMSAGLFTRALGRGQRVDPGFTMDGVTTAWFNLSISGYDEPRSHRYFDDLRARLTAMPGVAAVGAARLLPLSGNTMGEDFAIEGWQPPAGQRRSTEVVYDDVVDSGYFAAVQMPFASGRNFTSADRSGAPMVAIVNEAFAKRYWPGQEPLGRTIREDSTPITVVGVVRDAKYRSLDEGPLPFAYLPLSQHWIAEQQLLVRTTGAAPAEAMAAPIRREARALDPLLPVPDVVPLRTVTAVVLLPQRVAAAVTGVLGAIGLVLAAVGLYGVIAYSMSQRTREIGLRMALGADRASVLGLVLREGLRLVGTGMGIGLVLAAATTRLMRPFLFGISPLDPVTVLAISAALLGVAVLASYIPARRAAAADPAQALRHE